MTRLIILIAIALVGYFGYLYINQGRGIALPQSTSGKVIITQASDKLGELTSVLGVSIASTIENGKEILNTATDGASEPIINQLVTKTQETLQDLPRQQAEKIRYEFCRGIVEEYEKQ